MLQCLQRSLVGVLRFGTMALWVSCATSTSSTPSTQAAQAKIASPQVSSNEGASADFSASGTLGTIKADEAQATVESELEAASTCIKREARDRPYLGGLIEIGARINRDGSVKHLVIKRSTLGSLDAERCIATVMRRARFPRPEGGEAELSYPITWEARLEPQQMPEADARRMASLLRRELPARFRASVRRAKSLALTVYVDEAGRMVSAGMSATEPLDEDLSNALIATLSRLRFARPQAKFAKATLTF